MMTTMRTMMLIDDDNDYDDSDDDNGDDDADNDKNDALCTSPS